MNLSLLLLTLGGLAGERVSGSIIAEKDGYTLQAVDLGNNRDIVATLSKDGKEMARSDNVLEMLRHCPDDEARKILTTKYIEREIFENGGPRSSKKLQTTT